MPEIMGWSSIRLVDITMDLNNTTVHNIEHISPSNV